MLSSVKTSKLSLPAQGQAELYLRRSPGLQTRDGTKLIERIGLQEGASVLDLGCGTGNLTSVLSAAVGIHGKVLGIDPDKERIKVAEDNNNRSNVKFIVADGHTFPEGPYDLIFSNYVIHWIQNKELVFQRAYQSLKSGGKFAFTLCQDWPPLFMEILSKLSDAECKSFSESVHFVSQEALKDLAADNGFRVLFKDSGISRLHFTDFDVAMQFVFSSSSGYIDAASMGAKDLEMLKAKYMHQAIEFSEEYATFILIKD